MIGKVMTGRSFRGCLAYNLEREEAELLFAEGVRTMTIKEMAADFNLQRRLNPVLGQAVGHIVLSWSEQDKPLLTDEKMVAATQAYMERMQIKDTQYAIVRHTDRAHPHVHLVYNRVNNEGKTITDRYQKLNNARLCRALTEKYGYHLAQGKRNVNRHRLRGADRARYAIHDLVAAALKGARSWPELEAILKADQIAIHYKYLSGTTTVQGVSFSLGAARFKGSELDRSMSYTHLDKRLEQNALQAQSQELAMKDSRQRERTVPAGNDVQAQGTGPSLLRVLLKQEQVTD